MLFLQTHQHGRAALRLVPSRCTRPRKDPHPPTHPGVSGCQQFWGLKEAGPPGPPRTPSVLKAPARCTFECVSKLGIGGLPNPASSATESADPQPRHGSEHFYQRPRLLLCSVTGKEIKMDQKNPACCPKH